MPSPSRYWRCLCGQVFTWHSTTHPKIIFGTVLAMYWDHFNPWSRYDPPVSLS